MADVKLYTKVQDGKEYAGVLITSDYGAGWSTWNCEEMAYDQRIVKSFIAMKDAGDEGDMADFQRLVRELYPTAYVGGSWNLRLRWVERGRPFEIKEYDGVETVVYMDETKWITL